MRAYGWRALVAFASITITPGPDSSLIIACWSDSRFLSAAFSLSYELVAASSWTWAACSFAPYATAPAASTKVAAASHIQYGERLDVNGSGGDAGCVAGDGFRIGVTFARSATARPMSRARMSEPRSGASGRAGSAAPIDATLSRISASSRVHVSQLRACASSAL